ncbi:GrpB family protein [bacterium]|nr:GrpB family protein [bacterium]
METHEEKLRRVLREEVTLAPYDPYWPDSFREEKAHLLSCLPSELIRRIEHFGSTAVPGLSAKPIVDMLVEVTNLALTRERVPPILASQGYDYFWRPTHGDDGPPFYPWFIKRDPQSGARTHHIHMVEGGFTGHWDSLLFRDYLIEHPEVAGTYEDLKTRLAADLPQDRVAYTNAKTDFIVEVTEQAKRYYGGA